jgi:hypothetical protein
MMVQMSNQAAKAECPSQRPATPAPATSKKKKLSLDISEIDVVLERKISP